MSDELNRKSSLNESGSRSNLTNRLLIASIGAWAVGKYVNTKLKGSREEIRTIAEALSASKNSCSSVWVATLAFTKNFLILYSVSLVIGLDKIAGRRNVNRLFLCNLRGTLPLVCRQVYMPPMLGRLGRNGNQ